MSPDARDPTLKCVLDKFGPEVLKKILEFRITDYWCRDPQANLLKVVFYLSDMGLWKAEDPFLKALNIVKHPNQISGTAEFE